MREGSGQRTWQQSIASQGGQLRRWHGSDIIRDLANEGPHPSHLHEAD